MPEWLKVLLQILKDNPQAIGDLIALIGKILDFLEKNPQLAAGLSQYLAPPKK